MSVAQASSSNLAPNRAARRAARTTGRTRLTDPASTVLDGPGSTTVSCLLMQDTVAAGTVAVGPAKEPGLFAGKVALFANPFLDGKEEALAVDVSGHLVHLRRSESETGWTQKPVTGGGTAPLAADEVVVVVHHQDLTVWAVYTGAGDIRALRLDGSTADGVTTYDWVSVPDALPNHTPPLPLMDLTVTYNGRIPCITGLDHDRFDVWFLTAVLVPPGGTMRFALSEVPLHFSPAVADEAVGGSTGYGTSTGYVRWGKALYMHSMVGGSWNLNRQVASDAVKIVGVYPVEESVGADVQNGAGMGCVYLDSAGELVTSNLTRWAQGDHVTRTAGTGFLTAASWTDADQMMHVFGLDQSGALKVLHQVGWEGNGAPVWSRSTVVPPPPGSPREALHQTTETVASCVGLVADVAAFALDPYPGALPALLVELAGQPSPSEQFSIRTQDRATVGWTVDKVRLPADGDLYVVTHYVSSVTVLDRRGRPMAGQLVEVSAEALAEIQVDGASYLVGPGHSAKLFTNTMGRIVIATPADGLLPTTLHVDAAGLDRGAVIEPAAAVHEYLAGTGTLASQVGLFDGTALFKARDEHDRPIIKPGIVQADCDHAADQTKDTFKILAGQPVVSRLLTGDGPAPAIYGFTVGPELGRDLSTGHGPLVRTEFHSEAEALDHLEAIRSLPEYGGIWDDFVNWASDVWQGIKNGVIEVYKTVVHAVTNVFVWIGGKIVELVGFVIDTIEAAIHVVESVVRKVVDTVGRIIDWLKALFSFKDIWNTAKALESGVHTMMQYGATTVQHLGAKADQWFVTQEGNVRSCFEAMKAQYLPRPLADAANQVPAATDSSGQAVAPHDLGGGPQANWMLDRTVSSQSGVGQPTIGEVLKGAWDTFVGKVNESNIGEDFEAVLGDLATLMEMVVDPGDPDLAGKSVMVPLLDALEHLILAALKALDLIVDAAVALVVALVAGLDALLRTPLPVGPLNTLYRWIQTQSGIEKPDDVTVGGLIWLIAGFVVTVGYKIAYGVHEVPFPDGDFAAVIPAPAFGEEDGHAVLAVLGDPDYNRKMKDLKAACGLLGFAGAFSNAAADVAPVAEFNSFGQWFVPLMNATFVATMAGVVGSCPPVNGKDWNNVGASGAFAMATANAVCGWVTWFLYLGDVVKVGAFKNTFSVVGGPILTTVLSFGQLCFSVFSGTPRNDYAAALLGISAVPGAIQPLRIGIVKGDEISVIRAGVCAAIDGATGATAGLMVAVPALLPAIDIPEQTVLHGKVRQPYSFTVERTGERAYNVPLYWKVSQGNLPQGLTLDHGTGVVSGTPLIAGSSIVSITCVDSWSPPQTATRTGFNFVIEG